MFRIVNKTVLNPSVTRMEIEAPYIAGKALPGQFVIFRVDEQGERVPLTIADCDREQGTITLIFQIVGTSTMKLNALDAGDSILDLAGPLGLPTKLPEGARRVCVIGGGVGCAIAYPQAKALFRQGLTVDVIAGFRSKDIVILEDEFRANCTELILCTDDGSYGKKGFVTDALRERIESGVQYDCVIAIGPIPMMKFVCVVTKEFGIRTIVSLNPIMVDGTGMCGGCRVTVGGKTRYACVEGPDFDGHEVDFDELMRRNGVFREREAECRMLTQAQLEGGK
ncbi:MAG: sulfide/dihydroorotate dehydrogenase-like FAD/NAD-binding protein [Oscillospiraceae bacterium]|nr:sulfide/dihydroorotate dehydrogenase-like FAD/NAD-binding protein [Oscillospiraceae bacterium]